MSISLDKTQIDRLVPSIQRYIQEAFDEDIGDLKARLLLEFFLKELGPAVYNNGVRDAEQYFRERLEDLSAVCYQPEGSYWTDEKP